MSDYFTGPGEDLSTITDGLHELIFESAQVCDTEVKFAAFLTSFSQNFSSNWSSEEVFGRIDPIATFQGNKRTISIGWDIPAGSAEQAILNLDLFSSLAKMIYPNYNGNTNALALSKSPLVRMQFANLVCTPERTPLLGWISSLSWTPVIEMGYFEIGIGPEDDGGKAMYPKVVSLSVEFNVLHEGGMGFVNNKWSGGAKFPFSGE